MTRYRRSFAERNLVVIAVVGILVLGVSFTAALRLSSLPFVGDGKVHEAVFAESGGLSAGDEVRVAGVRVGEVTEVDLRGRDVVVRFRAKGVDLPDKTSAAVKVKTMLGQKFLAIDPLGSGELKGAIPRERTSVPYDVNAAFSDLSDSVGRIDTGQLEQSFRSLSDAFRGTPESVQQMVDGLTALSRTISTRDDDLAELLKATTTVSGTLAERREQIAALINDGSDLLGELQQRRDAVNAMLVGTADLGAQVRGFVQDNQKALAPALAKLDKVSAILERNQDNLDKALRQLGPYYRVLASATGNGPWADSYLCGLFDDDLNPILENDVVRNCHPGGAR
ncbi:MCE family protein [Nocardioides sp. BYT-33-1]|jgi:phospholipid/cholesterol/gamma-HCH transport system substrate-binding protein|uniref:MCE family protein n=1 Tax=Nocardioides sp. BYT-33-1 TaxID=3416952 RepID=UPI003F52C623